MNVPVLALGHQYDGDRAALQDPAGRVGHRAAGILHQRDARRAAGDGEPVGLGHFSGGEKLDHRRRADQQPAPPSTPAAGRRRTAGRARGDSLRNA